MKTKAHESVGVLEQDVLIEVNNENRKIKNKIDEIFKRTIDIIGAIVRTYYTITTNSNS